ADYSVNFKGGGRLGETLQTLTLTAPASFLFEEGTFDLLDGNTSGITATPSFLNNCRTFGEEQKACQSLMLTFGGTPFVMQNRFDYTVDVCQISTSSCDLVPLADLVNDLNGGTYTYKFS